MFDSLFKPLTQEVTKYIFFFLPTLFPHFSQIYPGTILMLYRLRHAQYFRR